MLGDPEENVTLDRFWWHLSTALDSLNTIKWRHYDQEVSKNSEVVECVLLAISVMASAAGVSDNEETFKFTLKEYLSEGINLDQFEKAWSNPLFSASMSTSKAERVIVAAQKEL